MIEKFAVIGLGLIGNGIARTLAKRGAEVIAIDTDYEKVEAMKDVVAHAVALDATDRKALEAQNIADTDAVVVAMGNNFEAALLCCTHLQEMGVKRILSRVSNKHQKTIFNKIGITETYAPDEEVGKTVAEKLVNPDIQAILQLPDDYEVTEVRVPRRVAGKTVEEASLRKKYNLNIVTVKRTYEVEGENGTKLSEEHIIGVPQSDTVFQENDVLILLGKVQDLDRFIEVNR